MSRVVWGAVPKKADDADGKRQTTLDNVKRKRVDLSEDEPVPPLSSRNGSATSMNGPMTASGGVGDGHPDRKRGREDGDDTSLLVGVAAPSAAVPAEKAKPQFSAAAAKVRMNTTTSAGGKIPEMFMKMSPQQFLQHQPDDAACWGPSGGGDRESMGRRRPRPFMNGMEMDATFTEASPYSRTYIDSWRKQLVGNKEGSDSVKTEGRGAGGAVKGETPSSLKEEVKESVGGGGGGAVPLPPRSTHISVLKEGADGTTLPATNAFRDSKSAGNTEFDTELLAPYLAPNCSRTIFHDKAFFLNSCDADPKVTTYILEKLIRYLGGSTSMSASGRCAYIVTQHMCSAKENKLLGQEGKQAKKRTVNTKYVHPHFILACAKEGRLVHDAPYRTITTASSFFPNQKGGGTAAAPTPTRTGATSSSRTKPQPANTSTLIPATATTDVVVVIDDDVKEVPAVPCRHPRRDCKPQREMASSTSTSGVAAAAVARTGATSASSRSRRVEWKPDDVIELE